MDATTAPQVPEQPVNMEVMEDEPNVFQREELDNVVTLNSDDDTSSSEEDDDDVIPLPARLRKPTQTGAAPVSASSSNNAARMAAAAARRPVGKAGTRANRGRGGREPDVIDLTNEEQESDDDDCMITDEALPFTSRPFPVPSSPSLAAAAAAVKLSPETVTMMQDDMPELIEVEPVRAQDLAEGHKKKGNDFFKSGDYYQALDHYSKAIDVLPTEASYHGNRSACYMMLKRYKEALWDIKKSLEMDPGYEKGYLRLIRTTLALGNIKECELAFESVAKLGMDVGAKPEFDRLSWLKGHMADIDATKGKKDYRKLVYLASKGLEVASADNQLKMLKADALVRLGRHGEAQELCTEVLQNDGRCVEALYIRSMCLYLDDNLDKSIQFVRQGLQFAPDDANFKSLFKKLKQLKELRESASLKYGSGSFEQAKDEYIRCLSMVSGGDMNNITIQSKLNFNLALIFSKLKSPDESIDYCTQAISLNSTYLKAILHRARLYVQREKFDDAVHDFEAALRIDATLPGVKREINNAKMSAKKAKRKDYYKILNVDKNATEDEIRKAYKKRAMIHHPDKHASAPESVQKEQERLFKDLGEAYEVLSDSKKRFRYDQGVDLMDDGMGSGMGGGGGGYGYADPSADFLNVFFANGGIPSFHRGANTGRGHAGQHFHHQYRH